MNLCQRKPDVFFLLKIKQGTNNLWGRSSFCRRAPVWFGTSANSPSWAACSRRHDRCPDSPPPAPSIFSSARLAAFFPRSSSTSGRYEWRRAACRLATDAASTRCSRLCSTVAREKTMATFYSRACFVNYGWGIKEIPLCHIQNFWAGSWVPLGAFSPRPGLAWFFGASCLGPPRKNQSVRWSSVHLESSWKVKRRY